MAEFRDITRAEVDAAEARARRQRRAVAVRYDRGRGQIVVRLDTGLELAFSPHDAQPLEHANLADIEGVELVGAGSALHFPALDDGLSVEGLLAGRLGSETWMAARRMAKSA